VHLAPRFLNDRNQTVDTAIVPLDAFLTHLARRGVQKGRGAPKMVAMREGQRRGVLAPLVASDRGEPVANRAERRIFGEIGPSAYSGQEQ
jgi:hypothetical protein